MVGVHRPQKLANAKYQGVCVCVCCFVFYFVLFCCLEGQLVNIYQPPWLEPAVFFFFFCYHSCLSQLPFLPPPPFTAILWLIFSETVGMGFPGVVEEEPKKGAILQLTVHTIPVNSVPLVIPRSTCTTLLSLLFQSLRPHSGLGTRKLESRAQQKGCGCRWESETGLWV